MATQPSETPQPADLSYGVALIPTNPLKDRVSAASLQITKSFDNRNIIDNQRFPAHVSLYLGGTTRDAIPRLCAAVDSALSPYERIPLSADRLYSDSRGFIGIDVVVDDSLRKLFDAVIGACASVHQSNPRVRPHLISRWPRLTSAQRALVNRFGTYKTEPSALHISVAQVDPEDLNPAFAIARNKLVFPEEFGIEAMQVVDVGHNNEKWEVLWMWSSERC